jgi:hypothetical protein
LNSFLQDDATLQEPWLQLETDPLPEPRLEVVRRIIENLCEQMGEPGDSAPVYDEVMSELDELSKDK